MGATETLRKKQKVNPFLILLILFGGLLVFAGARLESVGGCKIAGHL